MTIDKKLASTSNKLAQRREELGLTLEQVGEIVGVGKSTVRKWEKGDIKNMRRDKIPLLAKALRVPIEFIMGIESNSNLSSSASNNTLPSLTAKDERSIQKRLESVLNDLMPGNSALAFYDGEEPMSEEDKELLRISLENTMRLAKQMAKQKFTPKKYRN